MELTICDKCKRPIYDNTVTNYYYIEYKKNIANLKGKRIDLCKDCMKQLHSWISNAETGIYYKL